MRKAEVLVEGLLHPNEVAQFTALCRDTPADDFKGEWLRVRTHVARVTEAGAVHPEVDVRSAKRIAKVLDDLMRDVYSYDDEQRALLRGAIEYFILVGDEENDLSSMGFDDDAMVTNLVAKALGRQDLQVHLD